MVYFILTSRKCFFFKFVSYRQYFVQPVLCHHKRKVSKSRYISITYSETLLEEVFQIGNTTEIERKNIIFHLHWLQKFFSGTIPCFYWFNKQDVKSQAIVVLKTIIERCADNHIRLSLEKTRNALHAIRYFLRKSCIKI